MIHSIIGCNNLLMFDFEIFRCPIPTRLLRAAVQVQDHSWGRPLLGTSLKKKMKKNKMKNQTNFVRNCENFMIFSRKIAKIAIFLRSKFQKICFRLLWSVRAHAQLPNHNPAVPRGWDYLDVYGWRKIYQILSKTMKI